MPTRIGGQRQWTAPTSRGLIFELAIGCNTQILSVRLANKKAPHIGGIRHRMCPPVCVGMA